MRKGGSTSVTVPSCHGARIRHAVVWQMMPPRLPEAMLKQLITRHDTLIGREGICSRPILTACMATYQFAVQKESFGLLVEGGLLLFTRSTGSSSTALPGGARPTTLVGGLKPFIVFGLSGAYGLEAATVIDGPEAGEGHPVRPFWKHLPDMKSLREITWSTSSSLFPTVKLTPSPRVSTESMPWARPVVNLCHEVSHQHKATQYSIHALSAVRTVEKRACVAQHLQHRIAIPCLMFLILRRTPEDEQMSKKIIRVYACTPLDHPILFFLRLPTIAGPAFIGRSYCGSFPVSGVEVVMVRLPFVSSMGSHKFGHVLQKRSNQVDKQ